MSGKEVQQEGRKRRQGGALAQRAVREALVSLAGLLRAVVVNPAGQEIGHLADVICRWRGERYPAVAGLVVKVGHRAAYVPVAAVADLTSVGVRLNSARLDLRDFQVRDGEVRLAHDVLDHQLVDVDGVRVIRASDLYLARVEGTWRLVGAEVGFRVLLRRIGPRRLHRRPSPEKVLDWAAIQALGGPEREGTAARQVRLRAPNSALKTLRPAELADLLEELGRGARSELLQMVEPGKAADALEEMHAADLEALLREAPTEQAARLLEEMEPDEASEALRDVPEGERERLLGAMRPQQADRLRRLLGYAEDTAGALMTSLLVTATADRSVADVVAELRGQAEHATDLDAVCVLDGDGALVDDVPVVQLLLAHPGTRLGELVQEPGPVTVSPDAPLSEVVERLTDTRRHSVVVVDDLHRPLGRILADDLVDALVPERGRFRVFRLVP
ncbi:CBS domain-containing protein [Streptomyces sp. AC04842]|uniref:magnesium transporter MgtE N-terminal domain-containing protein n=1 Tax=Streptomyces sp. AC04842 TaxID=2775327 RepID=UPI0020C5DC4B|nr:magnesium transporter [Streptomyces sp. AC04842]